MVTTRRYRPREQTSGNPRVPGDLVEVDTRDLRPLPGIHLKQFTARDVISRWDVLTVHQRATSTAAALFLEDVLARMPFRVRAIQVDGGSEFKALFESECSRRKICLFELPPRSPKLNAHVKRAQRCHAEEFHELYEVPWNVTGSNQALRSWERTYNTIRPHQSLGYRTPREFLDQS